MTLLKYTAAALALLPASAMADETVHALEASTAAMEPDQDKFAQLELMKGVALACQCA